MTGLLLIVLMQIVWSFGQETGGGSFAYSDSTGNRYGGTYGLKDGRVVQSTGDFPVPFADTAFPGYGYGYGFPGDFYPNYFSNLENLLQEAFNSNLKNQRLAYNAARKAFDLSSNQAGYYPNFASRLPQYPYPYPDFGGFGAGYAFPPFPAFDMTNLGNGAYASAAAGPGYRQQIAAINPANPESPNVNINRITHYSDTPGHGGYYSVSSKSFSSSSNINGQEQNRRGAETVVNNNGKVTKYRVQS